MTDRSAKLRAFFARYAAERGGPRDPRIKRALAAVPRAVRRSGTMVRPVCEPLVHPVLRTKAYSEAPDDHPGLRYQDTAIALPRREASTSANPACTPAA